MSLDNFIFPPRKSQRTPARIKRAKLMPRKKSHFGITVTPKIPFSIKRSVTLSSRAWQSSGQKDSANLM
jgi:hypothetical protein